MATMLISCFSLHTDTTTLPMYYMLLFLIIPNLESLFTEFLALLLIHTSVLLPFESLISVIPTLACDLF